MQFALLILPLFKSKCKIILASKNKKAVNIKSFNKLDKYSQNILWLIFPSGKNQYDHNVLPEIVIINFKHKNTIHVFKHFKKLFWKCIN